MISSDLKWRTAKDCNYQACVEVAALEDGIAIRDSKNPDQKPLSLNWQGSPAAFLEFAKGIKRGDFHDLL